MKNLYNKYKDLIFYGIFGVLTTVVNIVSYYICSHTLNMSVMISTIVAWILAVLFAYLTNRKLVFHSTSKDKKDIVKELISFFTCRIATGLVDWGCMLIFVNMLHFNDMIIKIFANLIVIILNYVASKLIIFNNKKDNNFKNILLEILPIVLLTLIIGFCLDLNPFNKMGISSVDSSVFRNVGQLIVNGSVPYKDIFDHKGPLLYFINAIGQLINYNNGVWYIELIFLFVTFLFTYKAFNLYCKKIWSYLGTVLLSSILVFFLQGGNLTEEYAVSFIAISLYIFLDYFKNRKISNFKVAVCGACFACVCLIRINMIPLWIVFSLGVLFKLIKEKDFNTLAKFILYFLIGVMTIILPFMVYLFVNNAFIDFINEYFLFNFTYTGNTTNIDRINVIKEFLKNNVVFIATIINLLVMLKERSYISILNFLFLGLTLFAVGMSGSYYLHYGIVLLNCCVYPYAKLFESISSITDKEHYLIASLTFALTLLFIYDITSDQIKVVYNDYKYSYEKKELIVNDIKTLTSCDESITVYGNKTVFYLLTNRKSASKYYYQYPIGQMKAEIFNEYFEDLRKNQPKVILIYWKDPEMDLFAKNNGYKLYKEYVDGEVLYVK